jgi:hypothetical protein
MTSGLFENDMTDNLENYAGLSSHQRSGDGRWQMGVGSWEPKVRRMNDELGAKCTTVRMTRMRIGFSDKNWVCFLGLFEAEIDASCYICEISLIITIGFVL